MKLSEKAMLVSLNISQRSFRKFDAEASKTVADVYKLAEATKGRYNKVLIAQEQVKVINKAANLARTYYYAHTMPWSDDGARIITAAIWFKFTEDMRELESDFWKEVKVLKRVYPALKLAAQDSLGKLWQDGDYVSEDKLMDGYGFSVTVTPIPEGTDFRVNLQGEEVDKIREQIETRGQRAQEAAMKDLWTRLYDAVDHMVDRLGESPGMKGHGGFLKPNVFRNSLVSNMIELTKILPMLNLTGDEKLNDMVKEVQTRLCTWDPVVLREDETARKFVKDEAADIVKAMEAYMGQQEVKADDSQEQQPE